MKKALHTAAIIAGVVSGLIALVAPIVFLLPAMPRPATPPSRGVTYILHKERTHMPDPSILVSLRGEPGLKVATVTISNPDALNALTTDMQLQFIDAITTLEADDQFRGIIIRGAGEKAFSGGSMNSLAEIKSPADGEAMYRRGVKMRDTILNMKKPTIAAVSGWCIGGGFEIALSCDLIYASEDARFGMTEVDVGLVPGWGGAIRLPGAPT